MSIMESFANANDVAQLYGPGKNQALLDQMIEAAAFNVLHRDERCVLFLA
jgi:hypothetical protein